uniref:Proteasome subunit beta n=1 Tax=Panagrolaimus sp. ES5 TaxID=591445 RepID=A0AC34F5U0_9BILA
MSGMHFLIGCRTDNFTILASDKAAFAYGAVSVSKEDNKNVKLGEKLYMSVIGEAGDVNNFSDWAQRNLSLYKMRNTYELSPYATHFWLRKSIAEALRSENYWRVDVLLGGYDDKESKSWLSSIDYLGNGIEQQNYLFRGFTGRFCYAIMDTLYRPDMTLEEAMDAVKQCIQESKKRFVANLPSFNVLVIDKEGAHHVEDIHV